LDLSRPVGAPNYLTFRASHIRCADSVVKSDASTLKECYES